MPRSVVRRAVVLPCLLAACLPCAALAQEAGTGVCTAPGVIDTVVQQLRAAGVEGEVDARNPGEVTDAGSPVTTCAVWLLQPERNTNLPPGQQAQVRVAVQTFRVRQLSHSLLVDLTGPPAPPGGPGGPYPGPRRSP